MEPFKNIIMVALGGAIGSVMRYLVSKWISESTDSVFPFATLIVNIVGCLLIGVFGSFAAKYDIGNSTRLLLTVGLCGGFTTFSTFMNENLSLLHSDDIIATAVYAGLSVSLGLAAVWAGRSIVGY